MLSIPLLDQLHTLLIGISILTTAASLYLYTQSFAVAPTAIASLIPVLATIGGIALYHWLPTYYAMAATLSCLIIVLSPKSLRTFVMHAAWCASMAIGVLTTDSYRYHAKKEMLSHKPCTVHGLVLDKKEWNKKGAMVTVQMYLVNYQSCNGTAKFFVYSAPSIEPGTYAAFFKVNLSTPDGKPELAGYAAREHVLGIQFCPYLKTKKLSSPSLLSSWIHYWYKARNRLYTHISSLLPPTVFTYVAALFFGNKNCPDFLTIRTQFTRWGLTHYLARSGLHISLLVSLWVTALKIIPCGLPLKAGLLFLMLCIYDQLSWANISFNRALWLWFFYLGSWLTDRIATPLFGFCHLTLLILLTNPWYAGCLDFQLSFFLTGVLMIYSYYRKQQFMLSYCFNKNK